MINFEFWEYINPFIQH